MKRHEVEQHETRTEPPPFRVLSGTASYLSPTSPMQLSPSPSTRVPDSYKIVATSTSSGRAHRKSSFVIIAEARPATPNSRSSSPTLATGRVSPFRGRGFKGPLPHAQSRPQTPENDKKTKRSRLDRRVSVSQHNSPKRSLIPQPVTRSRSISLSKEKPSPKFGRRAAQRNNVSNAKGTNKKPPPKPIGLSPIRGTPTKDKSDEPVVSARQTNHVNFSTRPTKKAKNAVPQVLPPKSVSQKPSADKVNDSPSKIPLRRGSISNKSEANKPSSSNKYVPSMSKAAKSKEVEKGKRKPGNDTAKSRVESSAPKSDKTEKPIESKKNEAEKAPVEKSKVTEDANPQKQSTSDVSSSQAKSSGTLDKVDKETENSEKQKSPSVKETIGVETETVTSASSSSPNTKSAEKTAAPEAVKVANPLQTSVAETKTNETADGNSGKESTPKQENEAKNADVNSETVVSESDAKSLGKTADTSNPRASSSAKSVEKIQEAGSNLSLKSSAGKSSNSIGSIRSKDTGVSVNTVRGVSSAREKRGTHTVKRSDEIETLSGNVIHVESNGETAVPTATEAEKQTTREKLSSRLRKSLRNYRKCFPSDMRCLACRGDPKGFLWPKNKARRFAPAVPTQEDPANLERPPGRWSRLKNACRCSRLREMKLFKRRARVAPVESTPCCPPERRFGALCRRLFARCNCCTCKCRRSDAQRAASVRAKHSITSVPALPIPEETKTKIPDVLVEHSSMMRGAIPCLPIPLAWFCLVWNVLLPGSGTFWSGIFNLCTGQPRFSQTAGMQARVGAFVVNLIIGIGQLFTVLFCFVGWGWSIWWGITMIRIARKYKRFKDSEAAHSDPEARAGEVTTLPSAAPSQTLRSIERVR